VILSSALNALWNTYYSKPVTAGFIRLTALSDQRGTVAVATSSGDGKFLPVGRYSLLASEEPLRYEFRIPSGEIKLASVTISSPSGINFLIYHAELYSISGALLKEFTPARVRLPAKDGKGREIFVSPERVGGLRLDNSQNTIYLLDVSVSSDKAGGE